MDADDLQRALRGASTAHDRLDRHLQRLVDADQLDPGQPSRLEGWSVGHVITHLARNADSHVRVLVAAAAGMIGDQYAGGVEGRDAQIDAGAARPPSELLADLRRSVDQLEQTWIEQETWSGSGRQANGRLIAVADLPFRRWREVEVHHTDLGLDYGFDDWPDDYVRVELSRLSMLWMAKQSMGSSGLPLAALAVDPRRRLAWLLGRSEVDGLGAAGLMV